MSQGPNVSPIENNGAMSLWIIFALMAAAGVASVLMPLRTKSSDNLDKSDADMAVYRDQFAQIDRETDLGLIDVEEAKSAQLEISRRLLGAAERHDQNSAGKQSPTVLSSPRRIVLMCAIAGIPLISLGLYLKLGAPNLPGQPYASRLQTPTSDQSFAALIARAEAHLRKRPNDLRGWRILVPAYRRLGRFNDMVYALEQVIRIEGRKPLVLAEYGEALVFAKGGMVSQKATGVFMEAAGLDKNLVRPRYYLGLAALQDGRPAKALSLWQAMLKEAPVKAPWRTQIERAIKKVRRDDAATKKPNKARALILDPKLLERAQKMNAKQRSEMIDTMVARLAVRLQKNGNDLNGWLRLARAYMVLGKHEEASKALANARTHFAGDRAGLKKINDLAASYKRKTKP